MKPIILVLNIFATGYNGITLYPFIILKEKNVHVLAHELVHVEQVKKLGWFKFYYLYVKEYFKNRAKYSTNKEAYLKISYEIEACVDAHKYREKAALLLKDK